MSTVYWTIDVGDILFPFPTIINNTAVDILVHVILSSWNTFLKVVCTFHILIATVKLPSKRLCQFIIPAKRFSDLPEIKQLESWEAENWIWAPGFTGWRWSFGGERGMGWPEVVESGGLKNTLVKMDGLMKQLQRTGCLADNTCNFILSLKLPRSWLLIWECSDWREMKHSYFFLGCYCLVDPGFELALAGRAHIKTRLVIWRWFQGGSLMNALGLQNKSKQDTSPQFSPH